MPTMTKDEMRERPLEAMEFLNAERAEKAEKMLEVYTRAMDQEVSCVRSIKAAAAVLENVMNTAALNHGIVSEVRSWPEPQGQNGRFGVKIDVTAHKVLA